MEDITNTNIEFGKSYKVAMRNPSEPHIASMNGYEYVPKFTPAIAPTNSPRSFDGLFEYKYKADPIIDRLANIEQKIKGTVVTSEDDDADVKAVGAFVIIVKVLAVAAVRAVVGGSNCILLPIIVSVNVVINNAGKVTLTTKRNITKPSRLVNTLNEFLIRNPSMEYPLNSTTLPRTAKAGSVTLSITISVTNNNRGEYLCLFFCFSVVVVARILKMS